MSEGFDFKDLFVFDLANNHQGSVEHGLQVIRGVAEVANRNGVRGAMKFQFRQLDSFIHPSHKEQSDNKHIPRFLSTRLKPEQFERLLQEVRNQGLIAICTPFDEESVDVIVDMGFDILKVASCSARDWPLLSKISSAGLPIICSTGGLELEHIDDVVSFFDHRGADFAIMHCVSIYPTPDEDCHLNQIESLRKRYPERTIGWSTHEDPGDTVPVTIAVAKGARMFERHVGVATDEIKLNAYSSTPEQLDQWLMAYQKARNLCGSVERPPVQKVERESIDSLRRGVFARRPLKKGTVLTRDHVYFAMPFSEGQLESGDWRGGITLNDDAEPDTAIMAADIKSPDDPEAIVIKKAVHEIKAMLNEAGIALNSAFQVEYSHHYGIPNFRDVGAVLIDCVNREYCKKIIIQLPGQRHPSHYHPLKEETFQVLHGNLYAEIDGREFVLRPGETALIQPGVWHSFRTDTGVIFEEISTTHYNTDSIYKDPKINALERSERKTITDHWGRYQIYTVMDD
tara:strand:- start:475 stop:2013 length:1539 start_codon:yes stop_codon:yes gene_type:complete